MAERLVAYHRVKGQGRERMGEAMHVSCYWEVHVKRVGMLTGTICCELRTCYRVHLTNSQISCPGEGWEDGRGACLQQGEGTGARHVIREWGRKCMCHVTQKRGWMLEFSHEKGGDRNHLTNSQISCQSFCSHDRKLSAINGILFESLAVLIKAQCC